MSVLIEESKRMQKCSRRKKERPGLPQLYPQPIECIKAYIEARKRRFSIL